MWLPLGLGALAAFALSFLIHTIDVSRIEKDWEARLEAQKIAQIAACEADKQITKEVDHDQNRKINALNKRLADARRLYADQCVPIATHPSGLDHGSPAGAQPAGKDGVPAEALLDLAAEGERYRLTLISCQDFVRRISDR